MITPGGGLFFFFFNFKCGPLLHLRICFTELCMLHLYIFESEEIQEADEETLRCEFPRFTQPSSITHFSFFSAASP